MKLLKSFLPDVLLLAGAAGITAGAWMIYPPSGYIVGGALSVFAGWQLAKE